MAGKIKRIWEAIDACFKANNGPLSIGQIVAWVNLNYGAETFNQVTLKAQIYRSCVNVPFAQDYNSPKILFYDKKARTYSRIGATDLAANKQEDTNSTELEDESVEESDYSEDQSDLLVGVEAQLRDYLAKNLNKIEQGLTFWISDPPSVEYTIEGRRIDILARDRDGIPVVVELKKSKAYDRVVGQGLLYQALVRKQFATNRVRVVLIASEISEELRLATSQQADFKLFEYELTMQLNAVQIEPN